MNVEEVSKLKEDTEAQIAQLLTLLQNVSNCQFKGLKVVQEETPKGLFIVSCKIQLEIN